MSSLGFMTLAEELRPQLRSPVAGVGGDVVADRSLDLAKVELRGEVARLSPADGERLVPLGPSRALLVAEGGAAALLERARDAGLRAYDMSATLAALDVRGEWVMRRLTALDLGSLPATSVVARGVTATIEQVGAGTYRVFVPQEYARYVADVVVDIVAGGEL